MDLLKMALKHLTFVVMFISPLIANTVSSDIIQPSAITGQKGHFVQLLVQKHANENAFDNVEWLKDNSDVVVSYDFKVVQIYPPFEGRVDFHTGSYSLTLKNIQEADSGLYTARTSGESDIIIGKYNLTVIGTSSNGSTTGSVSLTWIIFFFLLGVMMI